MRDLIPGCRIGGKFYGNQVKLEVRNPATNNLDSTVEGGNSEDARLAVDAAQGALPQWQSLPTSERVATLRAIAESLRRNVTGELPRRITSETGKPLLQSEGEVAFSAQYFDWFAGVIATRFETQILAADRKFLVRRRPLGVVTALTPWNFPVSIPARKVAAALAAGCTVVFRPSELTPTSGLLFAEILEEHLPEGVLCTVTGDAEEIAGAWIGDDRVRGLSFTGSTRVGKLIAEKSTRSMTRTALELGGKAPFIVLPDADVSGSVEALFVAKYRNNGQSCIAANNVFVHSDIYSSFKDAFMERTLQIRMNDPMMRDTDLGPLVTDAHVHRLTQLVKQAETAGARTHAFSVDMPQRGNYFAPVLIEHARQSKLWSEEIFGPVVALESYVEIQDVVEEANSWPYGLGGYVCGSNAEIAAGVASQLEIGIVGVNTGFPNTPEVPFGGFKLSGLGKEGGTEGLDEFSESQTIATARP